MKYSFIAQHKKTWPIDLMCRVLGIKRNGYYRFQLVQSLKKDDPTHAEMLEKVKEIAKDSNHSYGERRIKKALNDLSFGVFQVTCRVDYPAFLKFSYCLSGLRHTVSGKSQFLVLPLQRLGFLDLAAS